ncbi:MAG: STAS domain-containing protein [Candidatus Rifleibacteriota bacterium]
MSLNIQSQQHENDIFVIEVQGEITFDNSDELKTEIDKHVEQNHTRLIIDLAGLKYMSSAGMGVLVHGMKKTRAKEGDLRLINLGAKMKRVFIITQFTHRFKVFDNLDQALNSFKSDEKQVT